MTERFNPFLLLFCRNKETTRVKMRVALAFILLIPFAMAFPIEKDPSLYEEEPEVFRDENEENNEVMIDIRFFVLNNQS